VKVRFRFLDGDREEQDAVVDREYATLGRHPLCTLAFDADQDVDVSSRHAAVFLEGDFFILRDLGSTNGTFVNGHRLRADHILADKDLIQFGQRGPRLEASLVRDEATTFSPSPGRYSTLPPRRTQEDLHGRSSDTGPLGLPREGTATRIRSEVAKQTAGFRRALWGLAVLSVALTLIIVWQRSQTADRLQGERTLLLARVDSLTDEITSMSVNVQSLREALDVAQGETDRIRIQLASQATSPEDIRRLSHQLQAALDRQEQMLNAAAMDLAEVVEDNEEAIALVIAQSAAGDVHTGTGFAIHTTESTGYLLTNKHVVFDSAGGTPVELGVVFNRSAQNFRAEIAAQHPNHDLVLLRVPVQGGVPIVKRLDWNRESVTVGQPVAILGFPLGLDLQMGGDWETVGVSSTMMMGTVTKSVPDLIQLDGYGAQGSSGSPLLDQDGAVVGVVYGGAPETGGRVLYAIPIGASLPLLDKVLGP